MAEAPAEPVSSVAPDALRRHLTLAYATPVVAWPWPGSAALNDALAEAILAAEKRDPTADNNLIGGWSSAKDLIAWKAPGIAEVAPAPRHGGGKARR